MIYPCFLFDISSWLNKTFRKTLLILQLPQFKIKLFLF